MISHDENESVSAEKVHEREIRERERERERVTLILHFLQRTKRQGDGMSA